MSETQSSPLRRRIKGWILSRAGNEWYRVKVINSVVTHLENHNITGWSDDNIHPPYLGSKFMVTDKSQIMGDLSPARATPRPSMIQA